VCILLPLLIQPHKMLLCATLLCALCVKGARLYRYITHSQTWCLCLFWVAVCRLAFGAWCVQLGSEVCRSVHSHVHLVPSPSNVLLARVCVCVCMCVCVYVCLPLCCGSHLNHVCIYTFLHSRGRLFSDLSTAVCADARLPSSWRPCR
jgi:hypothetical protein